MNEYPEFNGWQAVRSLGTGHCGESFEITRDDGFGLAERGALKIVEISAESDPEAAQQQHDRLEAMARSIRALDALGEHKNILPWRDHAIRRFSDGSGWQVCLRTDLAVPLERYLRTHTYGESTVAGMGAGICDALALCHERGIVHGDIKPQNLFVSGSNFEGALELRLGDFGMAAIVPDAAGDFAAPEVLCGEAPGAETDLYSLGMVLYWMLNDRRVPFVPLPPEGVSGSDLAIARDMRLRGDPIPAPLHGSSALQAVVLRAIADQPADRFQSAEEFRAALLGAVRQRQPEAAPAGAATAAAGVSAAQQQAEARAARQSRAAVEEPAAPPKRKAKRAAGIIGGVVFAALVILILAMAFGGGSSKKEPGTLTLSTEEAKLAPKETLQLTAELRDSDGKRVSDPEITWDSSAARVATVDSDGLVTAVEEGTAKITAEVKTDDGDLSASCTVTVTKDEIEITGITLSQTSAELKVGETLRLTPQLTPSDAPTDQISWTSSYPSIASVKDGVVTAVAPGSTTITAQANGHTAKCTVTVSAAAEIRKVSCTSGAVNMTTAGETVTVTFTVNGTGLETLASSAKVYAVDGSIAQVGTLQRTAGGETDTYSATVTALREGLTTVAFEIRDANGVTHSTTCQVSIVFPVVETPEQPDTPADPNANTETAVG